MPTEGVFVFFNVFEADFFFDLLLIYGFIRVYLWYSLRRIVCFASSD